MTEKQYFLEPEHAVQKRYEALRSYFVDGVPAKVVAARFGYTYQYFRMLCTMFRQGKVEFFREPTKLGHKSGGDSSLDGRIMELRQHGLSIYDISRTLTAEGMPVSHNKVWTVIEEKGGGKRLPKRTASERSDTAAPNLPLPVADASELDLASGRAMQCRAPLLLLFAQLLSGMDFQNIVGASGYRGTSQISAQSYLLSMLLLKLHSRDRKSDVMNMADDEGFGLFAGLNVLPKSTALHDYSYKMGPQQHRRLLHYVVKARNGMGAYPGSSFNLDFHMIRHYGDMDSSMLEKDYVPRRSQSVPSVVTAFAQESHSREMVYANANLLKREKADEAVAFAEYWKEVTGKLPDELVIDARVTTHKGLRKLDGMGITFITLRERRRGEVSRVLSTPADKWERVELDIKDRKWKTPLILDETVYLPDYGSIRQIAATDYGKEQPTLLITNDRRRGAAALLTRYARRTLIENSLGEQVHFFHVDALSSSVRIKVDLDTVLSVLASGCYRWLANSLKGYEAATARRLWETFIDRPGTIRLTDSEVAIRVRRFSRAPLLLEAAERWKGIKIPWLQNRAIRIEIA